MSSFNQTIRDTDIAVIGISLRFPDAKDDRELWRNLAEGHESIRVFSDEEILASGVVTQEELDDPAFVRSNSIIGDVDLFDAQFFGMTPREVELMDPQHRLFLECAWQVLEDAGYDPGTYEGAIGLFGGSGDREHSYQNHNLHPNNELLKSAGVLSIALGNSREYLPTRVSYKFNLRGPSVCVQTACSTSMVAVHLACQSLLAGDSDMALAGGVTICVPEITGYTYREGMIVSPDGHCRAFDARGRGTVWGNGVGIVCLKPALNALADGDRIRAIIKGTAINNDGGDKVGYTAPSIEGQAAVILEAQAMAECHPDSITYIEAHGTGTPLGDPIEIAALTQAFRNNTERTGYCALGTIKSNVGHLDTASGIAGLIKTVLALEHRQIPPSLHFRRPNRRIDFASSPFFVNTRLRDWESPDGPRRAGVSSFGIGGTNAHAIVEEAPPREPSGPSRPVQLLTVSAHTETALATYLDNLAAHVDDNPGLNLADMAFTLAVGRADRMYRRAIVCESSGQAASRLRAAAARNEPLDPVTQARPVVFMFSGQGSQYVDMGADLYRNEAMFRREIDRCAEILGPLVDVDIRTILYPDAGNRDSAEKRIGQTAFTQVALFAVEYALARLWQSFGIEPAAMIGHSVGDYVAATLAGVFCLEDALAIVAERGRLMQSLPPGDMMMVSLPAAEVLPELDESVSIAAVNTPGMCVIAGQAEAIEAMRTRLDARGVSCTLLHTSHAFHSSMMDPILAQFRDHLGAFELNPPALPMVNNVTGTWFTVEEITDPDYWVRHLREAVRFSDGLATLLAEPEQIFLEVGPGRTLATLAQRHPARSESTAVVASTRHPRTETNDQAFLFDSLGQLWTSGAALAWQGEDTGVFAGERRTRVALPTYPFERRRFWLDPPEHKERAVPEPATAATPERRADVDEWFYIPSWERAPVLDPGVTLPEGRAVVLVADASELSNRLARTLVSRGHVVTRVATGTGFERREDGFAIRPAAAEDYRAVVDALDLASAERMTIVHALAVGPDRAGQGDRERGFFSLMYLMQALGAALVTDRVDLLVLCSGVFDVSGSDELRPDRATLLGAVRTIAAEYADIKSCRLVDMTWDASSAAQAERAIPQIVREMALGAADRAEHGDRVIALRGQQRWRETWQHVSLPQVGEALPALTQGGTYLVTGGLGGIGMALAGWLARAAKARLVLVGRSAFPARDAWQSWLSGHGENNSTSRRIRQIQDMEAAGARVDIVQADVSNMAEIEAVLGSIQDRLCGVIHAAGVAGAGILQRKSEADVERVFAAKVQGTWNLDRAIGDRDLDFMVLCSSLTAVLGGFGQSDYCAANAFLDAFAGWRSARRPGLTLSLGWGAWQGVGMAAAATRATDPDADGVDTELEALAHPLFCRRSASQGQDASDALVFVAELDVGKHWFVDEHRVMGKATLPGTGYIEMLAAAYELATGTSTLEIQELSFLAPLEVDEDRSFEVRLIMRPRDDGYAFSFVGPSADAAGSWRVHARGSLASFTPDPGRQAHALDAVRAACPERRDSVAKDADIGLIKFGPRWQNIVAIHQGDGQCLAEQRLPDGFAGDVDTVRLHPALLDMATSALALGTERNPLPFAYQGIRIHGRLPAAIHSHVRALPAFGGAESALRYAVTITDEHGRVLVDIAQYTLVKLDLMRMQALQGESNAVPASAGPDDTSMDGIAPAEGVETLRRALAAGLSQVLVSSWDLAWLAKREPEAAMPEVLESGGEGRRPRVAHARPDLSTEYVEATTDTEKRIRAIWSEALGVTPIGINDNFFELGGDSLNGAQVAALLTEEFDTKVTPVLLFESPTIAGLARSLTKEPASEEFLDDSMARGQMRRRRRPRGRENQE